MKKIGFVLAFLWGISLAVGFAGGETEEAGKSKKIVLKIQHNLPTHMPWHSGFVLIKESLEKKHPDLFDITIYPSGQLAGGDWKVIFDQTQSNVIQMTVESQVTLAAVVPELISLSAPFVFDDMSHTIRFWENQPAGVTAFINKLEDKDLVVLGYWPRTPRQLLNSQAPVVLPEDIKGMKFRVPGIDIFVKTYEILGANPVPMPSGEIYTAMQLGTVIGEDNSMAQVYATKTFEQGKYMNNWNYMGDGALVVVNKQWFMELPGEVQQSIRQAVGDATETVTTGYRDLDVKARVEMEKAGIEFTDFDNNMKEPWRKAIEPVYGIMEELVGEDVFQDMLRVAEETR